MRAEEQQPGEGPSLRWSPDSGTRSPERWPGNDDFFLYRARPNPFNFPIIFLFFTLGFVCLAKLYRICMHLFPCVQGKPFNIIVVQVYAPTTDAEVDRFYEGLQHLLELTPKNDVLIIMGDWNAKAGSQKITRITGKFGLGVQNEAGHRLAEFCQENTMARPLRGPAGRPGGPSPGRAAPAPQPSPARPRLTSSSGWAQASSRAGRDASRRSPRSSSGMAGSTRGDAPRLPAARLPAQGALGNPVSSHFALGPPHIV
ncbi:Craniofacial development protein 2 [Varanus komodoensis]|nr:Craniofacial development protein 2 [Varanus komodoensis]